MRRLAFGRNREKSSRETVFSKAPKPYVDPASHTFCNGDAGRELNSSAAKLFKIVWTPRPERRWKRFDLETVSRNSLRFGENNRPGGRRGDDGSGLVIRDNHRERSPCSEFLRDNRFLRRQQTPPFGFAFGQKLIVAD
jgi:hypothetical protein